MVKRSLRRPQAGWVAVGVCSLGIAVGAYGFGLVAPSRADVSAGALPTATRSALDATKQAYEDRYAAAQATAVAQQDDPQVRVRQLTPPPPQLPGTPVRVGTRTAAGAGEIIETGLAPYPSSRYRFVNRWVAEKEGFVIIVYIGALADDPEQGVVVVESRPRTGQIAGEFRTPQRLGAIRAIGANGDQLTVNTSSGATFVFDVATLSFR